jgi:hypothetical protein
VQSVPGAAGIDPLERGEVSQVLADRKPSVESVAFGEQPEAAANRSRFEDRVDVVDEHAPRGGQHGGAQAGQKPGTRSPARSTTIAAASPSGPDHPACNR